jgi:drug/metabolite transporter (DMT)-like permease
MTPSKPTRPATRQPAIIRYGNVAGVNAAGRRPALAWAALGVVYVLWGSTYLANRFIITDLPPLFASGVRFLVGGSLLGILVLVFSGPSAFRMTWPQLGTTALAGLLLPAWGNGLVTIAQQYVASGLAALLIASVPMWIVVLRMLTGDRPRRTTIGGVGLGVAGLALLLLAAPSAGSGGVFGTAWWGPWLVLLAAVGWASGTFATTRMPVPANPFALAAGQMLVGGAILMAGSALAGDRPDLAAVEPAAWWAWGYMAVVVSLMAFSAYAYALAALPVSTVATYAYVNPVIAVLLGVLVAGESFSAGQLAGGGVVLLAVVVVIVSERPRKRRGELATSTP